MTLHEAQKHLTAAERRHLTPAEQLARGQERRDRRQQQAQAQAQAMAEQERRQLQEARVRELMDKGMTPQQARYAVGLKLPAERTER